MKFISHANQWKHLLAGHRDSIKHMIDSAKRTELDSSRPYDFLSDKLVAFKKSMDESDLWNEKEWIIDSFLHMHCNRLMGTDSEMEQTASVLACQALNKMSYAL